MLELWRLRPPFKNFQGETVVCYQNPGFVTDKQDECIVLIAPVQSSSIIGHPILLRGLHLNVWELPFSWFSKNMLGYQGSSSSLTTRRAAPVYRSIPLPQRRKKNLLHSWYFEARHFHLI